MKKKSIYLSIVFVLLLISFCFLIKIYYQKMYYPWPKINEKIISKHLKGKLCGFRDVVYDTQEKPLYYLDVRTGEMSYVYDDCDFNYSGLIDCRLYSVDSSDSESSTLLEDTRRYLQKDWESYGRFVSEDFKENNVIKENVRRECKLRGMKVVLTIKNIQLEPLTNNLISCDIDIAFSNDSTAKSNSAYQGVFYSREQLENQYNKENNVKSK